MKKLLTTSIIVLLFFAAKGQGVAPIIPEVIPPGPTAAELGRYGMVPVNMHTGNTNLSIPLHEFKTKNISVPISLSYNSSAIQVDEVATWVGMHWSLNAGGVITRIVRDQPDRSGGMPYPADFSMHDPASIQYVQHIAQTPDSEDTEPDLFTYNFLGYSGKLVFDRDGTPVTMPRNDLVFETQSTSDFWDGFIVTTPDGIKYSFGAVETTSVSGSGEGSYNVPTAWYLTKIDHPLGDVVEFSYAPDQYDYPLSISSTVSKQTNNPSCPSGQGSGGGGSDNTTLSFLSMSGKMLASITSVGYGSITFNPSVGRTDLDGGHKLSSIYVRNPQGHAIKSFVLDYTFSNNTGFKNLLGLAYEQFLIHRMFLTQVVERDKLTNGIKKYTFEYEDMNALPARLSNARDHWGYFNGANNSHPFPETLTAFDYLGRLAFPQFNANRNANGAYAKNGLLKKITYPTGGVSEFSYEGNTYYGSRTVYPNKHYSYLEVSGVPEQYEDIVSSTTITSGVDQNVQINLTCTYRNGYSSTYGHGKWVIYNQQGNAIYGGSIGVGGNRPEYVLLSGGQQYTVSVIAEGPPPDGMWANNTTTTLNLQYYPTAPQTVTENIQTGGIRIASITNREPGGDDEIINYHYARHNQLSQSSGKRLGLDPNYITRYTLELICSPGVMCQTLLVTYVALHSSGMNTLFMQNGNNIYYEYVTISRGTDMGTGLEEHQFIVSSDRQGTLVWGTDDIPGTPLSNISWNNGLEKAIRYYKKQGSILTLLKTVENDYTNDSRYHKEIPGLSFRRKYWPGCNPQTQAVFQCDASNINKKTEVYRCVTNHKHWLVLSFFYTGARCKASGHNMQWITIGWHPCYGKTAGETVYLPYNLNFVDAVEYDNISDWFYMSKQTVTTYDENGLNPIVQETNYFYDNDDHTQLGRQVTTSSTGKIVETKYKYARDYVAVPGDAIELMADYDLNMVGIPIEQIEKVDGQVIAASATDYDVNNVYQNGNVVDKFIAPKDIYRYETTVPGAGFNESSDGKSFSSYSKKATIHKHDDDGNVLEVSKENDTRISYIWGYGGKYPVAKIENVTYSSIPTANINDIKAKSNLDDDNCHDASSCDEKNLRLSLNALRGVLPGALITTFTYDPGIGLTSQTDANNKTTYFEYDSFGRLKYIKDNNNNILKSYDYHYVNGPQAGN